MYYPTAPRKLGQKHKKYQMKRKLIFASDAGNNSYFML